MKIVNRCVVTLKPKAAYIDWVKKIDAELPEIWDFEGGAYLFDDQETDEALTAEVSKRAADILANEFSVWTEDTAQWPEPKDINVLHALFTLHISIAVFDVGYEQLLRADVSNLF